MELKILQSFRLAQKIILLKDKMNKDKIIVNSWNEWDPLKHVIVGKSGWNLYTCS